MYQSSVSHTNIPQTNLRRPRSWGEVSKAILSVGLPVALLLSTTGCGPEPTVAWEKEVHPVSGVVTVGGKPAPDVFVVFHQAGLAADGEMKIVPRARTAADGSFELSTFSTHDGAPVGEYQVSFSWLGPLGEMSEDQYERLPEKLNRKLTNPSTSGVQFQVVAGENQSAQFAL